MLMPKSKAVADESRNIAVLVEGEEERRASGWVTVPLELWIEMGWRVREEGARM